MKTLIYRNVYTLEEVIVKVKETQDGYSELQKKVKDPDNYELFQVLDKE